MPVLTINQYSTRRKFNLTTCRANKTGTFHCRSHDKLRCVYVCVCGGSERKFAPSSAAKSNKEPLVQVKSTRTSHIICINSKTGRCPFAFSCIILGETELARHLRSHSLSCKLADCSLIQFLYLYGSCIIHTARGLLFKLAGDANSKITRWRALLF